jgi:hypothetical protein
MGISQDLLYFTDGNMLKINLINQTTDSISFTIYEASGTELYSVSKNELNKVLTKGGELIMFPVKKTTYTGEDYSSSIVSVNTIHIPQGRITMIYQFLNKSGNLGFEIPVSVGLFNDSYTDPLPEIFDIELYSMFYTGFGLNWYPLGQRKVSYVLGPSFRIGIGSSNYYYYDEYYYHDSYKQEYYSKLLINNGLVLNPSEHFTMAFVFSLGIMHRNSPPGEYKFGTTADFAINLGFRF